MVHGSLASRHSSVAEPERFDKLTLRAQAAAKAATTAADEDDEKDDAEESEAPSSTALPPARTSHAAAYIPGTRAVAGDEDGGTPAVAGVPARMVIVGGRGDSGLLDDVWVYDMDAAAWKQQRVGRLWLGKGFPRSQPVSCCDVVGVDTFIRRRVRAHHH